MTDLTSHGQSEKASIRMTGGPAKIFFAGKNFFGKVLALFLSINYPEKTDRLEQRLAAGKTRPRFCFWNRVRRVPDCSFPQAID